LAGFGSLVDTYEGDFSMMFRKWMIGICVAVAAMVGSAVAEAQGERLVGHSDVSFMVDNRSSRAVTVQLVFPLEEKAAPAVEKQVAYPYVAVPAYAQASFVHEAVEPTEKMSSRAHRLEVRDAKTNRVLYGKVVSMSKPYKADSGFKAAAAAPGYSIKVNRFQEVKVSSMAAMPDMIY